MKSIVTLTMNPTIDVTCTVDRLTHTLKLRGSDERYAPGGGGINVARVFVRLGGNARSCYLSGGATGKALDGLIDEHQLVRHNVEIAGHTRVAYVILERDSGREFRIVPAGPRIGAAECEASLATLSGIEGDFVVVSGSLPPGAPDDLYVRVGAAARERGAGFVLDTSGPALKHALVAGGVFLVKPSIGEFREFSGLPLETHEAIAAAAMALVDGGRAELVAVTLGGDGAILARRGGALYLPSVQVEVRSAVGAGDSFLAAMIHSLAQGQDAIEAFRRGVAAGGAALLGTGTDLAHRDDVERLLRRVPMPEAVKREDLRLPQD